MPPRLATLVASLALCAAAAGEPITATPWEVRKDAQELLEDLQNKHGEQGALLERVHSLLSAHGDAMIAHRQGAAPLAEVLLARLAELKLDQPFIAAYEGHADRRLAEIEKSAAGDAERRLLTLARTYPGTKAAARAWRLLADRAWDAGRIGLYLSCAKRAGETTDPARAKRVAAARSLLAADEPIQLPQVLDGIGEMWTIEMDARTVQGRARTPGEGQGLEQRLVLSQPEEDVTAASDGMRFLVFDHLVGRVMDRVWTLGGVPLPPRVAKPVPVRGGFVAVGVTDGANVVLRCLDHAGGSRWQQRMNSNSYGPSVSGPVAFDSLVAVAMLASADESADLKVLAFDATTGRPAWEVLVAKVPSPRRFRFGGDEWTTLPPALCLHNGSLLVLSNSGALARVSGAGEVQRIWSYPSVGEDNPNFAMRSAVQQGRHGQLLGDGRFAVATPADNPGVTLVLGPEDDEPRTFRGNGSDGEVVDLAGGTALLAGRNVTLLDLASLRPRWSTQAQGMQQPIGRIGSNRILVASRSMMLLFDPKTGQPDGLGRGGADTSSVTATQQILVVSHFDRDHGRDRITAYAGQELFDRLTTEARTRADDYRPMATLASLHDARGEIDQALACYLEALRRGAPKEHAARAARITRARLARSVGDEKVFGETLAVHERLVGQDPELQTELAWWKARRQEAVGDRAGAAQAYAALLGRPARPILLRDDLEVHVHTLAALGLARLDAGKAPAWTRPAPARNATPVQVGIWDAPARRAHTALVADGLLLGFSDGVLTAQRVADGTEAWWRQPQRPMLGVQYQGPRDGESEGLPVQVLPGSSADRAGLRSGDVLLSYNGAKLANFERDLRPAIHKAKTRDAFTLVVLRDGKQVTLTGRLGGEMVEPLAANGRTVLARTLMARQAQQDNQLCVIDQASGRTLWTHLIPPADQAEETPANALLTADDVVVVGDAGDLVGYAAHGTADEPGKDKPLWRIPGAAPALVRARPLGGGLLWLPDPNRRVAQLVESRGGEVLATIPTDGDAAPAIDGAELLTLGSDGRLSCWDLGEGRLRWRATGSQSALLAAAGDAVLTINDQSNLTVLDRASGQVRRVQGDWTGVQPLRGERDEAGRCLVLGRRDGRGVLASIAMPGAAVQWDLSLPSGVEVRHCGVTSAGVLAVLADGSGCGAVLIDGKGQVSRTFPITGDPAGRSWFPVGEVLLELHAQGARTIAGGLPTAPKPAPCLEIKDASDLPALAKDLVGKLAWQTCGDATYALARCRGSLVVFLRPSQRRLVLRVGDGGSALDRFGQLLLVGDGPARFNEVPGGWRLGQSWRTEDAGNGRPLAIARLEPTADRPPGLPLQVRAGELGEDGIETASDATPGPWWLRATWRHVTGF